MTTWKGRTPEQKAARKLRERERNREHQAEYRKRIYNGLCPHGGRRPSQPFVSPEVLREASEAYARRSSAAELLGDPPPGRSALDRKNA